MKPNLIEIEGLLVAADVDPMMGQPSPILKRPDDNSVILLGLTDAECNAAAQAYLDGVALRLVKTRDESPQHSAPDAQPVNVQLLEALKEAREALQFANDSPGGPITDTIWMVHEPETLFDFLDSAISAAEAEAPQAKPAYGPNNPPRLRRPGESVDAYRQAMGWPPNDQPQTKGRATLSRKPTEDITMDRITTTRPEIGEAYNGGFFAGLIRIGASTYGIIVAPKSTGETTGEWGPRNAIDSARSFFDGHANTIAMAAAGSDIACWAQALDIDGHADWYIPSRDELEICYRNLKPTDERNSCYSGDNPSAYLPAYAYMPDNPAQTAVEVFAAAGGAEAFDAEWYWTSTQFAGNASNAWGQYFGGGNQIILDKGSQGRVRAVRRFLID